MRKALASAIGLIGGLIAGYCTILFGWIAYTNIADVSDMGGGKAMGVAFFFAPVGALMAGIVCAIWLGRRAGRAQAS